MDQVEFITELTELNYVQRGAYFAILAFLVYDIVILFDNEVAYFWEPPKNAITFLYFVTRYTGLFIAILSLLFSTESASQKIDIVGNLAYVLDSLGPFLNLCIDIILILRVRALYSNEKAITVILYVAFSMELIFAVTLGIRGQIRQHPQPIAVAPGIIQCDEELPPKIEDVISWLVPLIHGTFLMTLAIYKATSLLKDSPGMTTVKLVRIIVSDQVIYFVALILVSLGQILAILVPTSIFSLFLLNSFGNPSILSSVGARLLLNMKEAGAHSLNEGMGSNLTRGTVSGMDFATAPARAASSTLGTEDMNEAIEEADIIRA